MRQTIRKITKLIAILACLIMPGTADAERSKDTEIAQIPIEQPTTQETEIIHSTPNEDEDLRQQINSLLTKHIPNYNNALNLSVKNSKVYISGSMSNKEARLKAIELSWTPQAVRSVEDDILLKTEDNLNMMSTDEWISIQLKTKLNFDRKVEEDHFTFVTIAGEVHLFGRTSNTEEADRVRKHTARLPRVKKVYDRIDIIKPEARPVIQEQTPITQKQ